MLLVKAQLLVTEGTWDDLQPLLDRLVQLSLAEAGCIRFEYFLDGTDAAHLLVLQEWKDRPSLERHEASEHVTEFKMNAASFMGPHAPTRVYVIDQIGNLSSFLSKS
jgi:quinol monooxygenase YgiN